LARQRLYTEGLAHLLQTVFSWEDALEEARKLLCLLEDESRFLQAIGRTRPGELTTIIGEENPVKELHPYSIISLNYGYDGVLGVLGPVRMDYSKIISTTQYIGNRLRAILTISKTAAVQGDRLWKSPRPSKSRQISSRPCLRRKSARSRSSSSACSASTPTFENYKKRQAREHEELLLRLEDQLLTEILPIYDNLERAFRAFNKNNDKDSFIEGIERIFAQFHSFLEGKGVRPIPAVGELFDPLLHEALITVEAEDGGKVLEEFERGYQRAGRVLRPSKVKVSKRKVPETSQSPESSATSHTKEG
jgi:molecular chaperone GrpE